ncbi:hypothetical protein FISHEDRAFT_16124, partial [Fistulina hepatica ATCC 64428]
YPCVQPSDSISFRTSLTKYLDGVRHYALQGMKEATSNQAIAWWWKDVVVRKSLFEECAGVKFERLLLALSTHAIM